MTKVELHRVAAAKSAVLRKMRDGWELGQGRVDHRYWIQKGGLGAGGESADVDSGVVHSLSVAGLIKWEDRFPFSLATLTAKGRRATGG